MIDMVKMVDKLTASEQLQLKLEQAEEVLQRYSKRLKEG